MSVSHGVANRPLTWVAIICGIGALAARPAASLGALGVTLAVGLSGALVVVPSEKRSDRGSLGRFLAIVTMGCATFALARWLQPGVPLPFTPLALTATVAAAVAEELFFRNLVYAWLARWGTAIAIGGAALLFALVHVPAYGITALPLDLAAGALLGWQRWASGGWGAPAMTHAVANIIQFLR
jgi:membrane protease YdiL (CAAX protease family)